MPLIKTDQNKCNLSYTCIRVCPAKAIKIEKDHAEILPSRCISCGNCVSVCSQNALTYKNSEEKTLAILKNKSKSIAICDPAISGEFDDILDYRNFVGMIKALGFDYVVESAFGVDLLAAKYKELITDFHGKYYISSKCPATINQIENFHHELIDNLAPLVTPSIAMAKVSRHLYGNDSNIVLLTPCVAAKTDIPKFKGTDGEINEVLSFSELRNLFKEKEITETSVEHSEFDPPISKLGGLFPISHGLFQATDINLGLLDCEILSTDGRNNFIQSINEFQNDSSINKHLDLFYCEGCIMGPGSSKGGRKFSRRSKVIQYVKKRLRKFDNNKWAEYMLMFKELDLSRNFKVQNVILKTPSENQIQEVLVEMGKENSSNQLDCKSCGYETCIKFAEAKIQGLSKYEMCPSYTIKKLNNSNLKLEKINKQLSETKSALKKSEKEAKREREIAQEASETVSAMLQKLPSGVVIVDKNLKIIESNKSFVKLLGEEAIMLNDIIPGLVDADLTKLISFHKIFSTVILNGEDILNKDINFGSKLFNVSVFTIKKNEVVGGIIRDLYAPEVRKEEVIGRARAVIKENLQTVQQIAFLLGESASKTEKILNSIIQSHSVEDKHNDEQ
ncbi:MAG: 4Fe-4S dicluster domain-containing protein [Marinifilaceae bacterium]|jgi:iron only hydrogenase large subunit-like protein|nr:4Fe-4S dicluster domain-containing protein [Marinifilaceae bacterium]